MRFAAALGLALIVVLAMLLAGLKLSGFMDRPDPPALPLQEVDLLSDTERQDLSDLLDGESRPIPAFPVVTDIPPLPIQQPRQRPERDGEGNGR